MVQNYTTQPGLHKLPNRRGYRRNNELVNEQDVSLLQYSRTSRDNRRRPSASSCWIQRIYQNEKINEKSLTLAGIFKMKRKDQWKSFSLAGRGETKEDEPRVQVAQQLQEVLASQPVPWITWVLNTSFYNQPWRQSFFLYKSFWTSQSLGSHESWTFHFWTSHGLFECENFQFWTIF